MSQSGRVITLEEFIIDTFTEVGDDGVERSVDRPDELGGGGSYGIIGARIFLPADQLGMIVDHTPETLPRWMKDQLLQYGEEMWFFRKRTDGNPTTRSLNRYNRQVREFEYLSPSLLLSPKDITSTPWTDPLPGAIHMISGFERLKDFASDLETIRARYDESWEPKIVWEPHMYDTYPSSIPLFKEITPMVDIITPNHTEALSLLSLSLPSDDEDDFKRTLSEAAKILLSWNPKVGVVIRCGSLGAVYIARGDQDVSWVPAYHAPGSKGSEGKVVDPTGAGNAFAGAMAAALHRGKVLREAVIWGTVAASFTIEQNGLPMVSIDNDVEHWNGEEALARVETLTSRVDADC